MINRTHRALTRGVSKETAFAYAIAEQTFPGESITREIVDACRGVTTASLERTQSLGRRYEERGLSLSPQDRLKLGVISTRYDAKDVADLILQGYDVNAIMEFPWLCHLDTDRPVTFPANGNEAQKQRWCTENGYAYLNGGWSKTSVGKIILTRLESGVESSIHDASQWLETFQIPEEGYDIQLLKAKLRDGEPLGDGTFEKTRFFDTELETSLLAGILQAPQELRDRLLLPRKTQKIQQIFYASEHQLLYLALAEIYRDGEVDTGRLHDLALEKLDTFYDEWLVNAHGKETTHRISKEDLRAKIFQALTQINESALPEGSNITGTIQQLSHYGDSRKRYIDDATSWLSRHMTSPNARLTKVWGDRAAALMDGVGDSAREIEMWQAENAIKLIGTDKMPAGLSIEEVLHKYKPWFHELSRAYSSDAALRGIAMYKKLHNPEALLPASLIELPTPDGTYRAEILAKNDPRGATIGVDTGCCMTIDGASASCIESGYTDKNAGFFALYTVNLPF